MKVVAFIITGSFFVAVGCGVWGALSRFGFTPLGIGLAALVCFIAAVAVGVLIQLEKQQAAAAKKRKEVGL